MKNYVIAALLIFISIVSIGCQQTTENSDSEQTIYTSLYPIQYATERIGGDNISVHTVYPPGVDAHTYEPTTKEMTSIAQSDAFIYLGRGMEGFADSASDALDSTDVKQVEIGSHEELFYTDKTNEHKNTDHGDIDPHIWLDPDRMIDVASYIKDALVDLQPDEEKQFNNNFKSLEDDLDRLDNTFKKTLASKSDKSILVSHAAYGYWEEAYDIDQLAIHGLSSNDEPSQRDLTKIIHQAKAEDMHYIIFEQNSPDHVAEIIQKEMDATPLTIHNLSVLTEKDMSRHEDYLSLMEENVQTLHQALD